MNNTQNVRPKIRYPDSSEYYAFDDIKSVMEMLGNKKTIGIKRPEQRKLAKLIIDLNDARKTGSGRDIQKRYRVFKEVLSELNLKIHEINEILNAILINENEYVMRRTDAYGLHDVVLLLLYACPERPIYGRIMITKQVFLAIKEVLGDERVENPRFVPYRYGPYSFALAHTLSNMRYDGFIGMGGKKNTRNEFFLLTDCGLKTADEKFITLEGNKQSMLADKRKSWDQLHQKGILNYVYDRYPEYTANSCTAHLYKSITWGRGIG